MRRFVRSSVASVASVVVLIATGVPALAATSGAGGVLSVSPAHPDPAFAVGKAYFVHAVLPGQSWTSQVAVNNTTPIAIAAWVDSVDGVTSSRTGAVFTARSSSPTGTAAWLVPHVHSITVAAHSEVQIPFTVHVPLGTLVGDHLMGIAFEDKQASASTGTVGITTLLRSVVAVQIRVPGPAVFLLHVFGATVGAAPTTGTTGIGIDMEDVGGLLGKPQLEIALNGPAKYQRVQMIKLDTMLPGDRINDMLLWPDALAPGDYTLSITDDGSGRQGFTYVTRLHLAAALVPTKPGRPNRPAATDPPSTAAIVTPILAGAAGAALLVVGVAGSLLISRRRRRCLHCKQMTRRARLMVITRKDEISGCMQCAVSIHNRGSGRLCGPCVRTHV